MGSIDSFESQSAPRASVLQSIDTPLVFSISGCCACAQHIAIKQRTPDLSSTNLELGQLANSIVKTARSVRSGEVVPPFTTHSETIYQGVLLVCRTDAPPVALSHSQPSFPQVTLHSNVQLRHDLSIGQCRAQCDLSQHQRVTSKLQTVVVSSCVYKRSF